MAVQSYQFSESFAGQAAVPALYPVSFPFLEKSHLRVAIKPTGSDEETPLPGAYWTLVSTDTGPKVRVINSYPSSTQVRVYRETPVLQPHVYQDASSYEVALDRLTMICQEGGGNGAAGGGSSGPSLKSIEWAREVWGPTEALITGNRWAGYIHKGGALASVRVSVAETGSTTPTLQILVGGAPVFALPVTLAGRTMLFSSGMHLQTVDDGAEVRCAIVGGVSSIYEDWQGLQIEFSIEG